jgi:hypothetical protein
VDTGQKGCTNEDCGIIENGIIMSFELRVESSELPHSK